MRNRQTSSILVAWPTAIALIFGATVLDAAPLPEKKKICHVPPGNPGNVHEISISENAVATHKDHHDDWYSNGDGDCHATTGVPEWPEGFATLACINRPGKQLGRQVETHPAGRISTRSMGCEL